MARLYRAEFRRIAGYGWLDAIHPDDRGYAEWQWHDAVTAQRVVDAEFRLRAPDGGWRWTNVRAVPVLDAQKQIEKWVGMNIDIDERNTAEAALVESEKRYRALFESMDDAFAIVEVLKDAEGNWSDFRFIEVNPAFTKHTNMPWPVGKTATELLGTPNPRWTELYGQALETGTPIRVEEPEARLGVIFDLYIFSLDRDRNRVAVLFTNITERKKAETALKEKEARQAFLLELSDALRPLDDPADIQLAAATALGKRVGANRVAYGEDTGDGETYIVSPNYVDGAPDMSGIFRYADYGSDILADLRAGHIRNQPDLANDARLSEAERQAFAVAGIGASLNVPLVKGVSGRLARNKFRDAACLFACRDRACTRGW
ncbi:PAS domain-containing protein [Devosia aurantiaca]|uniref:histidine kinase n=1 Tax=Devosia aurantiaca TaxID=2714858 RepID=A0A6M1SL71_9HYPH|nr:PAS domain S-box protein [Devosia aurantiaca]NGP17286.1 PAS domain-containing protein [Devosia aurantiaca]